MSEFPSEFLSGPAAEGSILDYRDYTDGSYSASTSQFSPVDSDASFASQQMEHNFRRSSSHFPRASQSYSNHIPRLNRFSESPYPSRGPSPHPGITATAISNLTLPELLANPLVVDLQQRLASSQANTERALCEILKLNEIIRSGPSAHHNQNFTQYVHIYVKVTRFE